MTIADRDLARIMEACQPHLAPSVTSAELVRRIGDVCTNMLMEGVGTQRLDWFDEIVTRVTQSERK